MQGIPPEEAEKLHYESVIVEGNHYGPNNLSGTMRREVDRLLASGAGGAEIFDGMMTMRIDELVNNPSYRQEYLSNWNKAGVTAICYSLFRFTDPWSFSSVVEDIADLNYLFDKLPESFLKITRTSDIRRAKEENRKGIILYTENTDQFGKDLDKIDFFYKLGMRVVQLTYNDRNLVGNGCTERRDDGLSRFGLEVVQRLNDLHMLIDLSHCGYNTTNDAIEQSRDPVVFTHTFAKALLNHDRGKTDEQIQAVAEKGGTIGVLLNPFFLTQEKEATIDHFVNHVEHVIQVAGVDHVAVGDDWYPPPHRGYQEALNKSISSIGFRPEHRIDHTATIRGFEDWSDWPNITARLLSRGYNNDEVKKILGGNFLRVFERVVG